MSWNAIIMRFGDAKTLNDIPPNFQPTPVTDSRTLKAILRRLFPDADHRDECSFLEGDDYWIELNYGCHTNDAGEVSAVGVTSNAGKGSISHLQRLCEALDSRLLDFQASEFADFSVESESSIRLFSEWRDRTLSKHRDAS